MPNFKSLLKPGGSSSNGTKKKQQQEPSEITKDESKSSSRGVSLFRRHSRSKAFRSDGGLKKSGSQSRIMSSCTSTSSLSSCGTPRCRTELVGMPKCNTVANFGGMGGDSVTVMPHPSKCSSMSTFTALAPSLRTSLVSLGLSRCTSAVGSMNGGGGSTTLFHRCRSALSVAGRSKSNSVNHLAVSTEEPAVLCRLCLCDIPISEMISLDQCSCQYCRLCLQQYVSFQVLDGNLQISCPDAWCDQKGVFTNTEIESLLDKDLFERYKRYLLNHEVDLDPRRVWCPRAGCETVCHLSAEESSASAISVLCPQCGHNFCSQCKARWHSNQTCETYAKKRSKTTSHEDEPLASYEQSGFIKRCPLCNIPIERNAGCAQMMCRRCKHVFCWYCLASLDNDFMLRHYDKGPCKNMLGHSRASVFLHRTQVVGIFAGLGLLLLVASPLLLLVAPCILCSNCKGCDLNEEESAVMPVSTSATSSSSLTVSASAGPVSGV